MPRRRCRSTRTIAFQSATRAARTFHSWAVDDRHRSSSRRGCPADATAAGAFHTHTWRGRIQPGEPVTERAFPDWGAPPVALAVANGALRASACGPRERALFARLELSAFMRGATHLHHARHDGGHGWWFAHRVCGVNVGIVEAAFTNDGLASETVASDELLGGAKALKLISLQNEGVGTHAAGASQFRDVLALAENYQGMLSRFGSRTRRNIRHVRRVAAVRGMLFELLHDRAPVPCEAICALAARSRPVAHPPRRIMKFERFIETAGRGFHSVLRARSGELVSYCRGFVDARTAYLIYQVNNPEWHYLSPSLLHRAHMIEALMAIGVRELIFVHGCSGLLHRACDPILVSQAWIRRPGLSANLLTWGVSTLLLAGGYRELAKEALRRQVASYEPIP